MYEVIWYAENRKKAAHEARNASEVNSVCCAWKPLYTLQSVVCGVHGSYTGQSVVCGVHGSDSAVREC